MFSGLAPGIDAETWITGNSTCGSGATGKNRNASAPARNSAIVSSEVPIGRLMKGAEMFKAAPPAPVLQSGFRCGIARSDAQGDQRRDTPPGSYTGSIAG